MSHRLYPWLGALIVAAPLLSGGRDLTQAIERWDRLGPVASGTTLPPAHLLDLDGQPLLIEPNDGRVHVIVVWATWCPACRSELDGLAPLVREAPWNPNEVVWHAVNTEGWSTIDEAAREHVRTFVNEREWPFPIALDRGSWTAQLRVGPIPHVVIVDRQGIIRHVHQGRTMTSTISAEVQALVDEPREETAKARGRAP